MSHRIDKTIRLIITNTVEIVTQTPIARNRMVRQYHENIGSYSNINIGVAN